ncbi:Lysine-specific metallo-endopeptidase [Rhizoctonia solani]|uniref:Lysine-specific metallo-endopeptidase n=1 Tax=Rhizoctonia solani TaxID=456999 RepID=A0A8H7HGM9_9AGAM|nr:Lysine-specific metallo-endopeptidase [Rhizoctonia solani]
MFTYIILILYASISAHADRSLSLKIVAPSATITDVDNFDVATIISNTGSETLRLLRDPRSPLSDLPTEKFAVVDSKGTRAEFNGIRLTVDAVAGVYNLTSTGAGLYTVDAANYFSVIEANSSLTALYAKIVTAEVTILGKLASIKHDVPSLMNKRASYTGCSIQQQAEITSAIYFAQSYARESHTHLKLNPSGSARYTRWFGTFGNGRYNKVLGSFSRLLTSPNNWTYDCATCSDPRLYAYVYPNKYGVVYLCEYFWNAPATGPGSKADTIIHEGTHFSKILGTRDYAYGQHESLDLAQSSPINAVYNAE